MAHLALARKWRPRNFDTLVGQDHVVRALRHALDSGRLHHAWLFTGTRGVGKTTLSRILAKALNCERGVSATPCGVCRSCTQIDAGRHVDYFELDAASNRGVDDMTQLLEQAIYAPSEGRYRVYMIDEVHMLTGHAFNAMLKTLEEPPEHVKFILATTDPQKMPVTVLSRCLQFSLRPMTPDAIAGHLAHVLQEEGLGSEPAALRLIARAARGSMRDALSLTDQAIAYCAGSLVSDSVQAMLGQVDEHLVLSLFESLAAGQLTEAFDRVARAADLGASASELLADMAALATRLAVLERLPQMAESHEHAAVDLAQRLGVDRLQWLYSVAVRARAELAWAPDDRAALDMALIRMMLGLEQPGRPPSAAIESPTAEPKSTGSRTVASASDANRSSTEDMAPVAENGASAVVGVEVAAHTVSEVVTEVVQFVQPQRLSSAQPESVITILTATADAQPAGFVSPLRSLDQQVWTEWAGTQLQAGLLGEVLRQSEFVSLQDQHLLLRVPARHLASADLARKLQALLAQAFEPAPVVELQLGEVNQTVHVQREAERAARQQAAEESIAQDPAIQALVTGFDARVIPGTIRPRLH